LNQRVKRSWIRFVDEVNKRRARQVQDRISHASGRYGISRIIGLEPVVDSDLVEPGPMRRAFALG
jgi:hypothetical protein